MFSNFELYRDGWIDVEAKHKHTRSWKGCLPCETSIPGLKLLLILSPRHRIGRKRKKTCTEERPVCQRCAKSNGSECEYSAPSKYPMTSPSPTSSDGSVRHSPIRSASLIPTTSPGFVEEDTSSWDRASSIVIPSAPRSTPYSVEGLPACSLTDLFFVFSPPAHALDVGPESSIISLTIPLIAQSPAVFHSMVSCSSIVLSQKQPAWQQVAIRHHCEALRSLAAEMSGSSLCEPSVVASSMAVIIMLHLFEVGYLQSSYINEFGC